MSLSVVTSLSIRSSFCELRIVSFAVASKLIAHVAKRERERESEKKKEIDSRKDVMS